MSAIDSPGEEMPGRASLASMPWPHSWSKTAAISPVLRQADGVGVEVDRRAVPEGVAGARNVHAGGELVLEPEVLGELAAGLLLQPVDLVEAAAAGARVAGHRRAQRRGDRRAVGARVRVDVGVAGDAQIERVPGRGHQRRRAAEVEHLDVLAVEAHGHRAVHAHRRVAAAVGDHLALGSKARSGRRRASAIPAARCRRGRGCRSQPAGRLPRRRAAWRTG